MLRLSALKVFLSNIFPPTVDFQVRCSEDLVKVVTDLLWRQIFLPFGLQAKRDDRFRTHGAVTFCEIKSLEALKGLWEGDVHHRLLLNLRG